MVRFADLSKFDPSSESVRNFLKQNDIEKEHIIWVILRILLYFVISVIILGVLLRIYNTIRKFIRKQRRKKGNR